MKDKKGTDAKQVRLKADQAEEHIRVRPNSRLVILGGCTLFANEPFTNQWCTRSIHLGNVSLFKTIELKKTPSEFSVLHNTALENPNLNN